MINSRKELVEYLECDKNALGFPRKKPRLFRDEIWRFEILLRKYEYYSNVSTFINRIILPFYKFRYHKLAIKLGFSIPINVFGKGLSIAHYGAIVVNSNCKIGDYCRIQENVTIGSTNGENSAPQIGNNVFIGSGARIIGNIKIGDDISIGANAVVVNNFEEASITIAGIPAKKISNKGSSSFIRRK